VIPGTTRVAESGLLAGVIFVSFGLFAPRNGIVAVAFFVCALSVSGAIFLILELDRSFGPGSTEVRW